MSRVASSAPTDETNVTPPTPVVDGEPAAPRGGPPQLPPPPEGSIEPHDLHRLLASVWRAATDRETPTFLQLMAGPPVRRVDVDEIAGYVAVVTDDDTHRAIGVRRDWVAALVAVLTARPRAVVTALLAQGPANILHASSEKQT